MYLVNCFTNFSLHRKVIMKLTIINSALKRDAFHEILVDIKHRIETVNE